MTVYGIEAEAEITGCKLVEHSSDDGYYSDWDTFYTYVAEDGQEYTGKAYCHSDRASAERYLVKKITVTFNRKTRETDLRPLSYFRAESGKLRTYFTIACIFSAVFVLSAAELLLRVAYGGCVQKKALKGLKCDFIGNDTVESEVVKTFVLFWFYIKIKVIDGYGLAREVWARGCLHTARRAF